MNEIFYGLISLTLTGSIISIILLLIRPFIKKYFSKFWIYYAWVLVLFFFILPARLDLVSQPVIEWQTINYLKINNETALNTISSISEYNFFNIGIIWFSGFVFYLIYKLTVYYFYKKKLKKTSYDVSDSIILSAWRRNCDHYNVSRVRIIHSKIISVPMMTGIINPMMIIPDSCFSNDELDCIFAHELTHYKRGDLIYKWFIQILRCFHWFNPMIHIISRIIERDCENSCDEAVIRNMSNSLKKQYGSTLIAVAGTELNSRIRRAAVPAEMSRAGKALKSRLSSIMSHKKISINMKILSVLFICVLLIAGIGISSALTTQTIIASFIKYPPLTSDWKVLDIYNSNSQTVITTKIVIKKISKYTELLEQSGFSLKHEPNCTIYQSNDGKEIRLKIIDSDFEYQSNLSEIKNIHARQNSHFIIEVIYNNENL